MDNHFAVRWNDGPGWDDDPNLYADDSVNHDRFLKLFIILSLVLLVSWSLLYDLGNYLHRRLVCFVVNVRNGFDPRIFSSPVRFYRLCVEFLVVSAIRLCILHSRMRDFYSRSCELYVRYSDRISDCLFFLSSCIILLTYSFDLDGYREFMHDHWKDSIENKIRTLTGLKDALEKQSATFRAVNKEWDCDIEAIMGEIRHVEGLLVDDHRYIAFNRVPNRKPYPYTGGVSPTESVVFEPSESRLARLWFREQDPRVFKLTRRIEILEQLVRGLYKAMVHYEFETQRYLELLRELYQTRARLDYPGVPRITSKWMHGDYNRPGTRRASERWERLQEARKSMTMRFLCTSCSSGHHDWIYTYMCIAEAVEFMEHRACPKALAERERQRREAEDKENAVSEEIEKRTRSRRAEREAAEADRKAKIAQREAVEARRKADRAQCDANEAADSEDKADVSAIETTGETFKFETIVTSVWTPAYCQQKYQYYSKCQQDRDATSSALEKAPSWAERAQKRQEEQDELGVRRERAIVEPPKPQEQHSHQFSSLREMRHIKSQKPFPPTLQKSILKKATVNFDFKDKSTQTIDEPQFVQVAKDGSPGQFLDIVQQQESRAVTDQLEYSDNVKPAIGFGFANAARAAAALKASKFLKATKASRFTKRKFAFNNLFPKPNACRKCKNTPICAHCKASGHSSDELPIALLVGTVEKTEPVNSCQVHEQPICNANGQPEPQMALTAHNTPNVAAHYKHVQASLQSVVATPRLLPSVLISTLVQASPQSVMATPRMVPGILVSSPGNSPLSPADRLPKSVTSRENSPQPVPGGVIKPSPKASKKADRTRTGKTTPKPLRVIPTRRSSRGKLPLPSTSSPHALKKNAQVTRHASTQDASSQNVQQEDMDICAYECYDHDMMAGIIVTESQAAEMQIADTQVNYDLMDLSCDEVLTKHYTGEEQQHPEAYCSQLLVPNHDGDSYMSDNSDFVDFNGNALSITYDYGAVGGHGDEMQVDEEAPQGTMDIDGAMVLAPIDQAGAMDVDQLGPSTDQLLSRPSGFGSSAPSPFANASPSAQGTPRSNGHAALPPALSPHATPSPSAANGVNTPAYNRQSLLGPGSGNAPRFNSGAPSPSVLANNDKPLSLRTMAALHNALQNPSPRPASLANNQNTSTPHIQPGSTGNNQSPSSKAGIYADMMRGRANASPCAPKPGSRSGSASPFMPARKPKAAPDTPSKSGTSQSPSTPPAPKRAPMIPFVMVGTMAPETTNAPKLASTSFSASGVSPSPGHGRSPTGQQDSRPSPFVLSNETNNPFVKSRPAPTVGLPAHSPFEATNTTPVNNNNNSSSSNNYKQPESALLDTPLPNESSFKPKKPSPLGKAVSAVSRSTSPEASSSRAAATSNTNKLEMLASAALMVAEAESNIRDGPISLSSILNTTSNKTSQESQLNNQQTSQKGKEKAATFMDFTGVAFNFGMSNTPDPEAALQSQLNNQQTPQKGKEEVPYSTEFTSDSFEFKMSDGPAAPDFDAPAPPAVLPNYYYHDKKRFKVVDDATKSPTSTAKTLAAANYIPPIKEFEGEALFAFELPSYRQEKATTTTTPTPNTPGTSTTNDESSSAASPAPPRTPAPLMPAVEAFDGEALFAFEQPEYRDKVIAEEQKKKEEMVCTTPTEEELMEAWDNEVTRSIARSGLKEKRRQERFAEPEEVIPRDDYEGRSYVDADDWEEKRNAIAKRYGLPEDK